MAKPCVPAGLSVFYQWISHTGHLLESLLLALWPWQAQVSTTPAGRKRTALDGLLKPSLDTCARSGATLNTTYSFEALQGLVFSAVACEAVLPAGHK
jgi:hypothetical protein